MKITTISVEYQRKLNLGQFESATVGVTLWADIDEAEDAQAAQDELWRTAKANVRTNCLPLMRRREEQVNEIVAGLPAELQAQVRQSWEDNHVASNRSNG